MTQHTAREPSFPGGPLVITLCSTSVPMMLQLPLLSVFAGLTVFRSRVVEDGRERFRMHLGYFHDRERAMRVLAAARRFYPGAFVTEAPQEGMGSLDDTLNTAFQFARGPATRLVVAEQLPSASEFESALAAATRRELAAYDDANGADEARDGDVAAGRAEVALADDMRAEHEFWARAGEDEPPSALAAEARAAEEPQFPAAPAAPTPATVVVVPATVALDGTAPVLDAPASAAAADGARPASRDRGTFAVQRYAVQLKWSLSPLDPHAIPHHALFRQFTLYGVTVPRGSASEHGLRLGFFSNLYSAKQVADYVRHDFPHASVVPVSEREMVRAQQAAWNELLARVGVGARRAPAHAEAAAGRPARRDGGLRRLWGRQT